MEGIQKRRSVTGMLLFRSQNTYSKYWGFRALNVQRKRDALEQAELRQRGTAPQLFACSSEFYAVRISTSLLFHLRFGLMLKLFIGYCSISPPILLFLSFSNTDVKL